MITHITSRDNPQIKRLFKLISSKKNRSDEQLFVIEGQRSCKDAIMESKRGNISLTALFCEQKYLDEYVTLIGKDISGDCSVDFFTVTRDIVEKISPENNSQGVFLLAKMLHRKLECKNLPSKGGLLVLNHLQDPGNVGTLLRTADAMGVSGVVLTNNCCDIYNPKVVRSTMGSLARVRIFVENDFYKVCEILKSKGVVLAAAVVNGGIDVRDFVADSSCAVVLGNEGSGLAKEHADLCDESVTVSMNGNIESLNAAIAGAVIMWEMFGRKVL